MGTIIDNDGPAISIDNVSVTEGNAGTVSADFTLSLSAPSPQEVTVQYETIDDTATAGEDYVGALETASFAPFETEQTLSITVNGDTADEIDESFFIALSGSDNGSVETELGQGTILNDDTPPTVSITDATVLEGNAGSSNATFTVSLSGPSSQTVTVNYASVAGTATSPADYGAVSGTLTFVPGDTSETITVPVVGDLLDEDDENYTIALSSPVNATFGDSLGFGTITDNDAEPTLSVSDVSVTEGNSGTVDATFTVTLSAPSGRAASVFYETGEGSASGTLDFVTEAFFLDFAAGDTSHTRSPFR